MPNSVSNSVTDLLQWLSPFLSNLDFDLLVVYMPKIIIAILLGGLLGWERRKRGKQAGIRTHMVLSAAACLVTVCGYYLFSVTHMGDPSRLSHGILAGVGFVGAGVIFKKGLNATGLTTSATILFAVGVGIACGLGLALVASATTLLVVVCLFISYRVFPSYDYGGNSLRVVCPKAKLNDIRKLFGPKAHVDRVSKSGELVEAHVHTNLSHDELDKLIATQIHNDDIVAIELLDRVAD